LVDLQCNYYNSGLAAVAYNWGEGHANGLTEKGKGLTNVTAHYMPIIVVLSAARRHDATS
jgi:hypothetical protein